MCHPPRRAAPRAALRLVASAPRQSSGQPLAACTAAGGQLRRPTMMPRRSSRLLPCSFAGSWRGSLPVRTGSADRCARQGPCLRSIDIRSAPNVAIYIAKLNRAATARRVECRRGVVHRPVPSAPAMQQTAAGTNRRDGSAFVFDVPLGQRVQHELGDDHEGAASSGETELDSSGDEIVQPSKRQR